MIVLRSFSFIIIGLIIISAIVFGLLYMPKFFYSPKGKYAVAMGGRSVMDMWFRYWNIPGILNKLSIYKPWPIPYKKYQEDDTYFEYMPLEAPHRNMKEKGYEFGHEMYRSLVQRLDGKRYDALLFKFCFVDFGDKSITTREKADKRFDEMISLTKKVHKLASEREMKLILGNSLPTLKPGPFSLELRRKYNDWVDEYEKGNEDVVEIDLFGTLADNNGRLNEEYSINLGDLDSHPNMKAFELLEEQLFHKIQQIKQTK